MKGTISSSGEHGASTAKDCAVDYGRRDRVLLTHLPCIKTVEELTGLLCRAGIIGLTCALKIQALLSERKDTETQVLIVAREWPNIMPGGPATHSADYASVWAGAHVRPIPATTPQLCREAEWLKMTCAEFGANSAPWAGITKVPGVEYIEAPNPDYENQTAETFASETGLEGYRVLSAQEKPEGIWLGFEYDTYCINTPVYLNSLLRKFILQGGKALKHNVGSEWEAFTLATNVVLAINASGTGFGDPKCFPTRGLTAETPHITAFHITDGFSPYRADYGDKRQLC